MRRNIAKKKKGRTFKGWHSSITGKLGVSHPEKSTEGIGYYVALEKETAKSFGRKTFPVTLKLRNPLNARGELPYILHESGKIFKKPKPTDSAWLSANKEAIKRSRTTEKNWGRNQARLNQALTKILQKRGYDGLLIENWAVKFAKPKVKR